MIRSACVVALLVLSLGLTLSAQTPAVGTERIGWDQAAPDLATAQSYRADLEVDGQVLLTQQAITCTGQSSPFLCTLPWPPMTPGAHSLRLRVSEIVNGTALTSEWSAAWGVVLKVAPASPQNLRLVFQ